MNEKLNRLNELNALNELKAEQCVSLESPTGERPSSGAETSAEERLRN
jgi:hypothetical protein